MAIFFNLERENAGLTKEILLNAGGCPRRRGEGRRREGSAEVGAHQKGVIMLHISENNEICLLANDIPGQLC